MSKIDKEKVEFIVNEEMNKVIKNIKKAHNEGSKNLDDNDMFGVLLMTKDISLVSALAYQIINRIREEK